MVEAFNGYSKTMSTLSTLSTRLNGWQRAWVVVSLVWLLAVISYEFTVFPTYERELKRELSSSSIVASFMFGEESAEPSASKILEICGADKDCYVISQTVQKRRQEQREEFRDRIQRQVEKDLPTTQMLFITKASGLWLAPMIMLYGLGMAITWVRRGFKSVA